MIRMVVKSNKMCQEETCVTSDCFLTNELFCSLEKDVDHAQNNVDDLQKQISDLQNKFENVEIPLDKLDKAAVRGQLDNLKPKLQDAQTNLEIEQTKLSDLITKVNRNRINGTKGEAFQAVYQRALAKGVVPGPGPPPLPQNPNPSHGGYVATTRRVILNGAGQKRVVYKKGGKGDDYVKIGGAFVNLKRNFTKKR